MTSSRQALGRADPCRYPAAMGHDQRHSAAGLTRGQVATRLGISTTSVRRLEWEKLPPVQDERGVWRFDPGEVATIAPREDRSGATTRQRSDDERDRKRRGLAARVFLMFARNRSIAEIVVATKQPPDLVRELYREWSTSLEEGEWDRRAHV